MQNNTEKYYNITKNIQPHLNVQKFLDYKLPPQKAIDIGCGSGRDTVALIKNNWEVLAIDKDKLIQFNEIEKDAKIASGEIKHWHIYDVIAKKCTILDKMN